MIWVAGAVVVLITAFEIALVPLLGVPPAARFGVGLLIAAVNATVAVLSGYLLFTGLRVVRPRASGPPALELVEDTLPPMRQGLNRETAEKTVGIVARMHGVALVAIADRQELLAVAGPDPVPQAWRDTLLSLCRTAIDRRKPFGRTLPEHEFAPAAAAPLDCQWTVPGAIALVGRADAADVGPLLRTARGLGRLLAMQIELGELDRQRQLTAEAELNALRAQINAHFLCNALNTIVSYSRDDPEMTRRMLVKLAGMFRRSTRSTGQLVPFHEEFHQVRDYLDLEQARFPERLRVRYDVDPQVLTVSIPALSLQPLVENAVQHGIAPKRTPGTVSISARLDFLAMRVEIDVRDDGVGMPPERLREVLRPGYRSPRGSGVGLANVDERLKRLFGDRYRLRVESRPGRGTRVELRVPIR